MASEVAVIDILRSDSNVTSLIGGAGTKANIYPYDIPQTTDYPCIVVSLEDIDPIDTKDGASQLDTEYIKVEFIDKHYKNSRKESGSFHLAKNGRTALDRVTAGTYSDVAVQSCIFDSASGFTAQINNNILFIVEHIYKLRITR